MTSTMDQLFVNVPSSIHAPPQTPLPLLAQADPSWNTLLDHDDDPAPHKKDDKQIRRRSSKACDQCRKSKCKCERPGAQDDPCKNCVLLGTPCTFLGPSRKRGPPKGYIDAIESRLHQMEALLGALLASSDPRARSLVEDLAGDPLARDILERVDESPFGTRPRHHAPDAQEDRATRIVRTTARPPDALPFASPSSEWQDHLKDRLRASPRRNPRIDVRVPPARPRDPAAGESPRQRRRLDDDLSPQLPPHLLPAASYSPSDPSDTDPLDGDDDDDDLASAVGQLSLNEDSQVRYHGKVSGLHILGQSDRLDKRNEGGIWRFPKAGVWPRASHTADQARRDLAAAEHDAQAHFPPLPVQQELLELYFAYVHPVLPLMHEAQFWRDFRDDAPAVPTLLLASMFAIAARYRPTPDMLPPSEGDMWGAGDEFLQHAKRILNQTYASSRPSTCQALLLLSYREVGIGAMAQAWLYVGMAVRMAQDLGMHRSAERWQRTGAQLFSEPERQLRKRVWYACVVLDKYVSAYIGRPLSIFERDCDTPYPAEDPAEERALWAPHDDPAYVPVPAHLISCFNASARLAAILSNVVETIYAVQLPPAHSRHADAAHLEQRLDRWFLDLPAHLQLTPGGAPPPHVYTLHMQYWCAVLLLHRPFMRRKLHAGATESAEACRKAFDLCALAATKIAHTVAQYAALFGLQRSPAFLTYYVFSASIMHMTTLSVRPVDIQAAQGLQRCMDALQKMQIVWPSAGRAWELVHGAKIDMRSASVPAETEKDSEAEKRKRDCDAAAPAPYAWPAPDAFYAPDLAALQGDMLLSQLAAADLWDAAPGAAFGAGEFPLYGTPAF